MREPKLTFSEKYNRVTLGRLDEIKKEIDELENIPYSWYKKRCSREDGKKGAI